LTRGITTTANTECAFRDNAANDAAGEEAIYEALLGRIYAEEWVSAERWVYSSAKVRNDAIDVKNQYTVRRDFEVAAEAATGADTFVFTVTAQSATGNMFLFEMVLCGGTDATTSTRTFAKKWAISFGLSGNTLYDSIVSEIYSIGDADKAEITAGVAAVGSGNAVTITFTNTDASAFSGVMGVDVLSVHPATYTFSMTHANNQ
jgi:hypothetical protein